LGTPDLVYDIKFFESMSFGFMWATVVVGIFCLIFTQYITKIAYVPFVYYFPLLVIFIIWACVQYTGGWEDYAILIIFIIIGILAKKYKFSRPSILIGFILTERVESLTLQLTRIYDVNKLVDRPIFLILLCFIICLFVYTIFRKNTVNYV